MPTDLTNLRPLCAALAASDFARADRLKAIIQVAYEVLGASSIIAYKHDRLREGVQIIAMPGVVEREIMRGPTPEPIFDWETVSPGKPPSGIWLENQTKFDEHMRALPKRTAARQRDVGLDFRARELKKHGGVGDLALARICLYKGEGQTLDKVGQLFFNFHKLDPKTETFTEELRSAIWFVSTLVRELLIEDLYHKGKAQLEAEGGPAGSLHLLRVIDEKLKPASAVTLDSLRDLAPDLRSAMAEQLDARIGQLAKEKAIPESIRQLRVGMQQRLSELRQQLVMPEVSPPVRRDELEHGLRIILPEALSRELWYLVCRAALEIVETYGGQADIILVLGDRVGRRILPRHSFGREQPAYLWLHPQTVTGDCIERGKVFVCNNVPEKGSKEARERFDVEPFIEQFNSLLVVPVTIEGEIRAVLRLMSTDKNCFLDKHAQAIEDMAFVTSYALNVLDSRQRRDRISDALAYFAEGQAVAGQPSAEELLKRSLLVLGAEFAVFWPVERTEESRAFFRQGTVVSAYGSGSPLRIPDNHPDLGIREDGFTQRIYRLASASGGHLLFCHHVVQQLQSSGKQHHDRQSLSYVLQIFAEKPCDWMRNTDRTIEGFYKQGGDSTQPFPGFDQTLEHNTKPGAHLHSRIGFPVREKESGHVRGIAWICFPELHHLDWSERLFICALSNYLAQAMKADGLTLAIRSFQHMLVNVCDEAILGLDQAGNVEGDQSTNLHVEGLPPAPSVKAAVLIASDVLFSVKMKADEVKVLLDPGSSKKAFAPVKLSEVFRRAWSVGSDLSVPSSHFQLIQRNSRNVEIGGELTVIYDASVDPEKKINGALYTVSLNLLSNSFKRPPPCVVWVSSVTDRSSKNWLQVVFGDGGEYRGDLFASPELAPPHSDGRRGVGIPLVKEVLRHEGGRARMLNQTEFRDEFRDAPAELLKCQTLALVVLPLYTKAT